MVCLFQQCKLTSLVVVRWERERSFSCSQRPSLSRSQRHSLVLVLYRLSFPFPAQSQFATLPIPKNSPKLSLELTMQRGLVCNNTKVLPRRPGFQEAFPTSCPATLAQSRLHPVAALSLSLSLSSSLSRQSLGTVQGGRRSPAWPTSGGQAASFSAFTVSPHISGVTKPGQRTVCKAYWSSDSAAIAAFTTQRGPSRQQKRNACEKPKLTLSKTIAEWWVRWWRQDQYQLRHLSSVLWGPAATSNCKSQLFHIFYTHLFDTKYIVLKIAKSRNIFSLVAQNNWRCPLKDDCI